MKIQVDREKCTGIGLCESFCPDMFEVDDEGWLNLIQGEAIPDDLASDVDTAISACPTAALSKHD